MNKPDGGLWAMKRPWDIPLKNYVKTFPLLVTIYDDEKILHEETIDYGNYEHRKLLGRITFWACNAGYIVETVKAE